MTPARLWMTYKNPSDNRMRNPVFPQTGFLSSGAAMQGREIMEKEGGIDKLTELGLKKDPTVDDFSAAGFDVEALDLSHGNMKILSDQFATVSKAPAESTTDPGDAVSPTVDQTIDLTTEGGAWPCSCAACSCPPQA